MKRMMIGPMAMGVVLGVAAPAAAGGTNTVERNYAAYGHCLMSAAAQASYTPTPSTQIYAVARSSCEDVRRKAARHAALEASDSTIAARMPALIDRLRERRRMADALYGIPSAPATTQLAMVRPL